MKFILSLLLSLIITNNAYAITVEQAYKNIPHQQTTFKASNSKIPSAIGLEKLFSYVDKAIVLKVEVSTAINSRGKKGINYEDYERGISGVKAAISNLQLDPVLSKTKELIISAIEDQNILFKKSTQSLNLSDPLVTSSSDKLKSAYGELMRLFVDETPTNKQAFFDHLCALDFI